VETLILKSIDSYLQYADMGVNLWEGESRRVRGASVSFFLWLVSLWLFTTLTILEGQMGPYCGDGLQENP
jgi:hypothetical protein